MALFTGDDSIFSSAPFAPVGAPTPTPPIPAPKPTAAPSAPAPTIAAPAAAAPKLIQPADTSWESMLERFMSAARQHESGGDDSQINKETHATGRYQFLPSTWYSVIASHPELGLTMADIFNGDKQDVAYRAFVGDNAKVLQKEGLPVNPGNLFMLSFMGSGGGPAFLKAMQQNPGAIAANYFPKETKSNLGVFYNTDDRGRPLLDQPRTLAQVYQFMTKSFGGAAPAGELRSADDVQVAQATPTTMSDAAVDGSTTQESAPLSDALKARLGPPPTSATAPLSDALKARLGPPPTTAAGNPYMTPPSKPPSSDLTAGVDINTGEPIFSDPKAQEEYDKSKVEIGKGVISGVAQDVTGAAEWLPNSLGGAAAARGTKALQDWGDPTAQMFGRAAPFAVPIGEGLGVLEGGAKIVSEGLPALGRAMFGGARTGAEVGAVAGADTPTGIEDQRERYIHKGEDVLGDAAAGAVGGGVVPGALGAGKVAGGWIGRQVASLPATIRSAIGKEAAKSAENLLSGVNAETGKALTAQEAAVEAASVQEGVKRAEQAAAESTATKVADLFARQDVLPREEFGKQLQEAAEADARALKDARSTLSGYDAAANADGGRPSVPTKQFIAAVSEAEKDAVSGPMKATLANLKQALRTQGDANSPTVTAVSIQRARRIIQDLDGKINGVVGDERNELKNLKQAFVDHLETVHPNLKAAKARYAELSRPLDVYRDSGPLAKAILEDPYSGQNIVDVTKVVGALLNKSESGADALGRLVAREPALKDAARKFFTGQLKDAAGVNPAPSYKNYADLLKNQRLALDRAGLTDEFKALAETQKAAETGLQTARTQTQKSIDELARAKTTALKKAEDIRDFQREIGAINQKRMTDVPGEAQRIAGAMKTAEVIDGPTYERMVGEIGRVKDLYRDEVEARKKIRNILIAGAALYEGHSLIRHTLPLDVSAH